MNSARHEAVAATLGRIERSELFAQAERQRRLLRYIVEKSLAGDAARITQFTLGIDVFDRGADFDPAIDSVVRVEVGRLRAKLREYYEGAADENVVIRIPKGRYVADFEMARDYGNVLTAPLDEAQTTVAVMRFEARGDSHDERYFADGFAEDLITDLSKISGLNVIARPSSFAYDVGAGEPREIGRELGASHLLHGSVRVIGGRMRINVQLMACDSAEQVWAERYDRDMADLFALQDELGRKIVAALSIALTPADRYRRASQHTASLQAYDAVLRATALSWSLDDVYEACRLYDQAVALDSDYAVALAKRANLEWYLWRGGWAEPNALEDALALARRAVEADPELGEAHGVLAFLQFWAADYQSSDESFDRAQSREPANLRNFERRAICLAALGRTGPAREFIERAGLLNPHEPYYFPRGSVAFAERDFDEAIRLLRGSTARFPSFLPARIFLAAACATVGDLPSAGEHVGVIIDINPRLTLARVLSGWPDASIHPAAEALQSGFEKAWKAIA